MLQLLPSDLAGKQGSAAGIHLKTYHRWLSEADVAAFVASRL